jgi:hypothetical protein
MRGGSMGRFSARIRVAIVVAVLLVACGGAEPDTSTRRQAGGSSPTAEANVSRQAVEACLADAGLKPEDTGLFVIGSAGTNVEAMGVKLAQAGRTLLFVFDKDAATYVDFVQSNSAEGYADVSANGNVVVAFESAPSSQEREQIASCLTA